MSKYVKVMFDTTSGANNDFKYKIDEVNVSDNWNPTASNGKDFGGFNYASEECILRWLHRGDTIYDVEVPEDAEVVKLEGATIVYRTNKIIIRNPRKVDDMLAKHFYEISKIPEKSYYKALAAVSVMGYQNTAYQILKDKVNKDNIDEVIAEWDDFIIHGDKNDRINSNNLVPEIDTYLKEIKSDLLISRFTSKDPYIKDITSDKIINLTGESGSGKSYFSNNYKNNEDYIIIDTDIVFSSSGTDNKDIIELRKIFQDSPSDYLIKNFDDFYIKLLNYFKDCDKTIVIDSAQYRNIKDYSILKGRVVVIRTSAETCYQRVLERWKLNNPNYNEEDYQKYSSRKSGILSWYKYINQFLEKVEKL